LLLIGAILGGVLGLRRVLQWMAMLEDARDAACSGTEYGRVRGAEIGVETGLSR
jgi:hypothetical protein